MRTFGEIEKELRIQHGYTMEEVAEGTHTTKAAISRYESGTREPAFRVFRYFCEFYGVTADYLLGLTDDRHGHFGNVYAAKPGQHRQVQAIKKEGNVG